ncbi:hypothetical protein G7046_g7043 [Stylonectria norvegica]|nr:hypothetical protein G7046_g7043 [Stylonectria norvegica]
MPRTKPIGRRSKAPQNTMRIGLDDLFPIKFLEHLYTLPSADDSDALEQSSSSHDDRPSKRRRANPSDYPSIHVAKGEVTVSRRCLDASAPDFEIIRRDVDQHLHFAMSNGNLRVWSQSGSPISPFSAFIALRDQDNNPISKAIVDAAGSQPKKPQPGGLWSTVDLTFYRVGPQAFLNLVFNLHWKETPSPYHALRPNKDRPATQQIIDAVFPVPEIDDQPSEDVSAWSPMHFYEAAFVPSKEDNVPASIVVPGLKATLFPYQKRTLQWLLRREGVQWSENKFGIEALESNEIESDIDTFRTVTDVHGKEFFLSDILHTVTRDKTAFRRAELAVKGGLLAEEMGLGKTLEILGLIILHPRPSPITITTFEIEAELTPTSATLIVTPESLREQWMSEISRHAPGLSVKFYAGCKSLPDDQRDNYNQELASYDVIVTTYAVLSAELHYSLTPPDRPRRHEKAYPFTKSPLVQISWWRVCLDEAQMIENGFIQAATVARGIPRENAWGITGTPVKDDIKDLFGLLLFLRYNPYCFSPHVWQALIQNHKRVFRQIFNSISLRHTKAMVRDEVLLPPQKRYVISMPFTAVEEQHYQSLYDEMVEACRLSTDGTPAIGDWDPQDYEETMRMWLNRLRQTTLHPDIPVYNRRVLGNGKARPMRTVDEVLDAMLEQSENTIRTDERVYLSSKLTRGQMYENSPRVREALQIWQDVGKEAANLVSDARNVLQVLETEQKGGKSTHKLGAESSDSSEESDDEPDDVDTKWRLAESRRRLRGALEMQHKAVFFCANAHFQIRDNPELTEPESDEFHSLKKLEDEGYEEAKAIRREILRESHSKATRHMDRISRKASDQTFTELAELTVGPEKGIESTRIIQELEELYGELNEQAGIIDDWREHAIQLLLKPLLDEEEQVETTGEELGESARIQDELMVYVQALRALVADRQDAISGQTNELVKHETKTSLKLAEDGEGPAPEKLMELLQIRGQIKPGGLSMRGALGMFRTLISKLAANDLTHRTVMEREIAEKHLKATQALISKQSKSALALESEIESFKDAMNTRMEYFRQLQTVSDSVLPYEGERNEATIQRLTNAEEALRKKLSSAQSKHRYLQHLKEAGSKSNEPRMCVICQTPFSVGVLTVCGHQFCKECMMLWFKAHHNCPVCKKTLKASNLHDITINPQQLKVHSENPGESQSDAQNNPQRRRNSASKQTMIYSEFNSDKLAEIQNVELDGPSFTTKVDTLVKHLLWLRESDPGAKSIIFSQYKGFLGVLENAFRRFRIGYASIEHHGGITKFKEDASVECFLLHGRAQSSGLNLVNASHVFLCEPVLNTALELQAIARVDRIGQQHETTVWLYLVSGTVEESIYNLSVQRRMAHMQKTTKGKAKDLDPELLDASIEAANTLELEQAALSKLMSKDRTAGEMVNNSDLWECLFGHVARKEAEPHRDNRFQEQAVMGYLAAEAAEERRAGE